jgi:hypothetical protein
MQKKKYFFSLAVFVVSLVGIFGGHGEALALDWCCVNKSVVPVVCTPIAAYGSCDGGIVPTSNTCENLAATECSTEVCCVDSSETPPVCGEPKADGTCNAGIKKNGKCSVLCPEEPVSGSTNTTITFPNPITANSIDEVLTSLLSALSGLVVTLAIIFIVLGGILYMLSAGDPGMIKRAKDCWLFSVIGLAIVVAAPTFLKQVQEILGGRLVGGGVEDALTVLQIATNVLNFLLSIVGIIAIISLVVAGSMYMTAYGDDTRAATAKKMGTWAVIGIAIALGSLVLVQQVAKLITG